MNITLCIIFPIVIFVLCEFILPNGESKYQLAKSIWYFYSALFLIFNYFGEASITSEHITGFSIALALLEGLPGIFKLIKIKATALINEQKRKNNQISTNGKHA